MADLPRLVMMGTGTFARPTFEAILAEASAQVVGLVTQPDREGGQQRGSTRLAERGMKEMAVERGIPVLQPESINTPEGVAALQQWQPELLVVAAYGQILSREVLAAAKQGGINVHASLLPKYRGAAPIAWAIYHGEKRTGVTIIRMSVGLDAGDILAQETVDILPDETAGELETRLGPLGARLALETVQRMEAGPVNGMPQDKTKVTKAPKLTKEMGLIDWTKEAAQVCNQIRAMQPWPTAYTYLHSAGQLPMRIIICKARLAAAFDAAQKPGEALAVSNRLLIAANSPGLVSIDELQPAGKRRMSAADFLRGKPISPGDHFGPERP